ncbi:hypothetical protein B0H15DRAFT_803323 [Mycena belliarum]|uniref:Uncharacterized protein n=1 Tax=Mycena belliarum TaxID=1033014 RepID=A0AAD6TWP8_9AGAR|nr:hypothetical protein B0H15DRAFT_803323 [Mycena belliae]
MIRAQGALSGTSPKSCLYGKHVHVHFVDFSGIRTSWLHKLITEVCPKGIDACATSLVGRERLHKPNTDHMNIDPTAGWITIGGSWGSRGGRDDGQGLLYSFGPARLNYKAFMCYDLLDGGKQSLSEYGVWTVDNFTLGAKGLGQKHLNLSVKRIGGVYKSGAPLPYDGTPKQVTIRVVVSFVSTDQAYTTTKSEVGNSSSEDITSRPRRFGTRNSRRRKPTFPTPENLTISLHAYPGQFLESMPSTSMPSIIAAQTLHHPGLPVLEVLPPPSSPPPRRRPLPHLHPRPTPAPLPAVPTSPTTGTVPKLPRFLQYQAQPDRTKSLSVHRPSGHSHCGDLCTCSDAKPTWRRWRAGSASPPLLFLHNASPQGNSTLSLNTSMTGTGSGSMAASTVASTSPTSSTNVMRHSPSQSYSFGVVVVVVSCFGIGFCELGWWYSEQHDQQHQK